MRIARLYLPFALMPGEDVLLAEEHAHYLSDVLRLRTGSDLVVFNGEGGEYPAALVFGSRKQARVRIGGHRQGVPESPLRIHLGLGISRGERMDLAIQKSVELGVHTITPLEMERSVVKLDAERRTARRTHWVKVAQSACEQCGRTLLPEIAEPRSLDAWLAEGEGLRLLLDPTGPRGFSSLSKPSAVRLLSGPEGGFDPAERTRAIDAGYCAVRLGPRVLRTETAAIAALTAVQLLWGDLGD